MMQSKASKDSSRGFQVSSEISFLISVRKTLPTSGQTVDLTSKFFSFLELNGLLTNLTWELKTKQVELEKDS